jgi:hypothetical protein
MLEEGPSSRLGTAAPQEENAIHPSPWIRSQGESEKGGKEDAKGAEETSTKDREGGKGGKEGGKGGKEDAKGAEETPTEDREGEKGGTEGTEREGKDNEDAKGAESEFSLTSSKFISRESLSTIAGRRDSPGMLFFSLRNVSLVNEHDNRTKCSRKKFSTFGCRRFGTTAEQESTQGAYALSQAIVYQRN